MYIPVNINIGKNTRKYNRKYRNVPIIDLSLNMKNSVSNTQVKILKNNANSTNKIANLLIVFIRCDLIVI